nr:hypothetical protein [uncultured Prevotella sp.]
MKNKLTFLAMGLVLALTSCGDQHKAQSLVKDFLNENLEERDCSYERFSRLTPTAMIDMNGVKDMRQHMSQMPYMKKNINYQDASAISDTLLYIRATYKLTDKTGKEQELTQTFYMDKALTRVVAFKEN